VNSENRGVADIGSGARPSLAALGCPGIARGSSPRQCSRQWPRAPSSPAGQIAATGA
jgi:hypothetical protein